jgi:hypothetical protein
MSSVVISGDSSGAITLAAPSVAGTNTATLPAATGTVMVSGNMPAFYAYQANSQTITSGANTKVTLDGELFDTNNCFASSRFTPTVAGYYQLSATVFVASSAQEIVVIINKNGTGYSTGLDITNNSYNSTVTTLAYANGTTDYFEVYLYLSVTRAVSANVQNTYFTGSLVRTA